jgi:integrase
MPWRRLWQEVWQRVWRLPCPDPCSAGLTRRAARRGSGIFGISEPRALSEWAARMHHNAGREGGHDPGLADPGRRASISAAEPLRSATGTSWAEHEPPTNQEGVRAVLRGIRRTIGSAKQGKAPATADLIGQMLALCPDTMIGKRDRALLALGFAGAFRWSELCALEVANLTEVPDGLRVLIRRSKGDQEGQGQEVAIPRGYRLRLVEAVQTWLEAAPAVSDDAAASGGRQKTQS